MFGKPIAGAKRDDLDRLIREGIEEGRHLEFKEDFPSRDTGSTGLGWTPGKPIPSGRIYALLEELVAFANADGGVIVLGMKETKNKPPRAASLSPLAQVVELERKVRDCLNDVIEPRLPYASVKAIPTEADGSGVLLLETQPSALGPHWVRPTKTARVRREDRADPLSMPEIHDMVLRNARRFSEVEARLAKAKADFEPLFFRTLDQIRKPTKDELADRVVNMDPKQRYYAILGRIPHTFLGLRVTIVPHQSLGISRIEDLRGLIAEGQIDLDNSSPISLLYDRGFNPRRVLGGMVSRLQTHERSITLRIGRDGFVELDYIEQEQGAHPFPSYRVLGGVGSALGCYQCLREFAGSASMPGEVDVELITMPDCCPVFGEGERAIQGQPLEFRTHFPTTTIAEVEDFDEYLNELAGDFANAGGLSASSLPRYRLKLRMPNGR